MKKLLISFLSDETAATAVEYAFMLALIIMICLGAILIVGQTVSDSYSNSSDELDSFITN